jgi:hypothetical protein
MANAGVRMTVPLGLGAAVVDAGATVASEPLGFFSSSVESVSEAHVAAGVAGRSGALVGSVAAGPAVVRVNTFEAVAGRNRLVGQTYAGAYGSAQAVVAVSRGIGLGAEAFGVLNAGQPTGGLRLFLAVGALR